MLQLQLDELEASSSSAQQLGTNNNKQNITVEFLSSCFGTWRRNRMSANLYNESTCALIWQKLCVHRSMMEVFTTPSGCRNRIAGVIFLIQRIQCYIRICCLREKLLLYTQRHFLTIGLCHLLKQDKWCSRKRVYEAAQTWREDEGRKREHTGRVEREHNNHTTNTKSKEKETWTELQLRLLINWNYSKSVNQKTVQVSLQWKEADLKLCLVSASSMQASHKRMEENGWFQASTTVKKHLALSDQDVGLCWTPPPVIFSLLCSKMQSIQLVLLQTLVLLQWHWKRRVWLTVDCNPWLQPFESMVCKSSLHFVHQNWSLCKFCRWHCPVLHLSQSDLGSNGSFWLHLQQNVLQSRSTENSFQDQSSP